MSDTPAMLRQRIALYRRYLAEGVTADVARHYLESIAQAEAKLAEMRRPASPPAPNCCSGA